MMLSVPINGQVQPRLIPPTFVEDNISDMFKAVDAGHNIVVTAVDEYGNRTSITTPDNVNHDMLGRPLEFASHPVLMRNVRRWMVWLLQAQYCKDYKWDTNRLGGWMEVLGLPADLDIPMNYRDGLSLTVVHENNKEYVERNYPHGYTYPTLVECKQDMRHDYPRAKFYYGYRNGFNVRLSERFEELRKQSLAIPSGRELVSCKSQRLNEYFDKLELVSGRAATARGSKDGFARGVSDANNVGLGLSEMGVSSHALLNA